MGSVRLWVILLIVPAAVWLASTAVSSAIESDWYSMLEQQFGPLTPFDRSQLALSEVCSDDVLSSDVPEWCRDHLIVSALQTGSILTGIGSGALILMISVAGRLGQGDRTMLLTLFRPGLIITLLAVTGLVGINSILAIGAIFYVLSEFMGIVFPIILLMIGLGGLIGLIVLVKAGIDILQRASTFVIGRVITREDSPELWRFVDSIAREMNAKSPKSIVAGLEPNFFVTEADVQLPGSQLAGESLYISLPLCRILTLNELHAIVAHELTHFQGEDTKFSQDFYPIYRGAAQSLDSLSATAGESLRIIPVLPALAILSHFLDAFSIAERSISRDREFAADRFAAQVTSGQTIGSALVKVHTFSKLWSTALERAWYASSYRASNASAEFADLAMLDDLQELVFSSAGETVSHPTDSHPQLGDRLKVLGVTLDDVVTDALNTQPQSPATELISDHSSLEEALTELTIQLYQIAAQTSRNQP